MKINEQYIIDFLAYKSGRPLKIKELAKEMNVPKKEYSSFRRMVTSLINEGRLVKIRRGRIGVPSELNLVVGNISIAKNGQGSILTDSGELVSIEQADIFTALNGDKVIVRVGGSADTGLYGTVIKILERADNSIIGIFNRGHNFSWVSPDDRRLRRDIYIPNRRTKKAADGDRVLVKITLWEKPNQNPEGEIVEVLGDPNEPGVDMLTVMRRYSIPEKFPSKVIAESEAMSESKTGEGPDGRQDFSDEITYTIDPFDAKDHDDAISVERTERGYRLGVFIADVSHFVKEDTELDKEAFNRGNSVYLPGMVIPMLPEKISNELCSLKPNRRRMVYAVLIDYSKQGKMLDWKIVEGVIKSRAKLSYEEVQQFFDSGKTNKRIDRVADSLLLAGELVSILLKKRMAAGSLDFDLPEAKIVMNKKGEVIEIGNRVRLESHRLVEEFMLAANQAVALHVFRLGQKLLYRVHDRPDMEKLESFSYMMKTLGYKFPVSEQMKPLQFSRFLEKIKGRPEEELVNELMLRSMKKAVYQPKNVGHFGLAFKHYAHFTSPIRRYPDLIVHRLLKKLVDGRYPVDLNKRLATILTHVGFHCSDTERNAEAAEREAVRYKQADYMTKKVGERYSGVISGILNFGFFVRLDENGAEGLVRLSSLDDDYYNFDEKQFRLVGRRTGRIFRMGDPVEVGVLSVDKAKKEINLFLIESQAKTASSKKKRGRRR